MSEIKRVPLFNPASENMHEVQLESISLVKKIKRKPKA
jgi:hypothetical protein